MDRRPSSSHRDRQPCPTNPAARPGLLARLATAATAATAVVIAVVMVAGPAAAALTGDPGEAGSGERGPSLGDVDAAPAVSLTAELTAANVEVGEPTALLVAIANTTSTDATGVAYTIELPPGLAVSAVHPCEVSLVGSSTIDAPQASVCLIDGGRLGGTGCTGSVTATPGTSTIVVTDELVPAAQSCHAEVPVVSGTPGTYVIGPDLVTSITGADNDVVATSLVVTGDPLDPNPNPDPQTDGEPEPEPETGPCRDEAGWTAPSDQVERLYRAALGRPADSEGRRYWTHHRLDGMTSERLAAHLLASAERLANHADLGDEAFIEQLYELVLDRQADDDGKAYWLAQLDAGMGRAVLLLLFSDSDEHIARTGTSARLSDHHALTCRLYRLLFGRNPDDGGYAYWSELQADGNSPAEIVAAMLALDEADHLGSKTLAQLVDLLASRGPLKVGVDDADRASWLEGAETGGRAWLVLRMANRLAPTR